MALMSKRRLDFDLYVITDRMLATRPLPEVIGDAARLGQSRVAFQLREKDLPAGELLAVARELLPACRQSSSLLFINDRVDVALASGADGVQLSRKSLPADEARKLLPRPFRIGVSVHGIEEAAESTSRSADFLVVGPIFSTRSKAHYGPPIGLEALRAVRLLTGQSIVAIGGIQAENAGEVIRAGADAVAVISAVMCARDCARATASLLQAIRAARGV